MVMVVVSDIVVGVVMAVVSGLINSSKATLLGSQSQSDI